MNDSLPDVNRNAMHREDVVVSSDVAPLRGHHAIWQLRDPIPADLRAQLPGMSVMVSHLLFCRGLETVGGYPGTSFSAHRLHTIHCSFQTWCRRGTHRAGRSTGRASCEYMAILIVMGSLQLPCWSPLAQSGTPSACPSRLIGLDGHGLQPEGLAELADGGGRSSSRPTVESPRWRKFALRVEWAWIRL